MPINLNISGFDRTLLNAPINFTDFIHSYIRQKEIFDIQGRHKSTILNNTDKISFLITTSWTSLCYFSNNFITDNNLIAYLLCKHKKIRALIASLVLHQVKEVDTIPGSSGETNSECTTLAYIGITLTILSLIIVTFYTTENKYL